MLTTLPTVFKRGSKRRSRFVITKDAMRLSNDDKKRAPSVVAECPTGRSGTLRTTREGKSPAESGTVPRTFRVLVCERIAERFVNAVPTSGA
ncbi:hypothetical protein, partial [Halolamina sp.]|uniref:hypothetical protein n=1 Tax=Halolamina sp. TaxID=1940283 RepID=UPI003565AECE